MTVVADVIELHRRKIPLPEIAAACLTSFQRVEEIIQDARPRPRQSHPRRPPRRQRGPSLPTVSPINSTTSLAAKSLSRSDCDASFGDQCIHYLPNLRRYARRLAPDRSTAEDLLQDTLVLALANQHRFTPGTNLSAWLVTIMHNQRINGLRRAVRERKLVDLSVQLSEVQNAVSGEQEINRQIQELRRAMEQLTEDKRTVLLLAYDEGLSYVEIADMLKVPIGTVRSKLARARSRLHEIIDDGSGLRPDSVKRAERKADMAISPTRRGVLIKRRRVLAA
jgi:RNA polymerase sigma-70 factor (ECF subfamily)